MIEISARNALPDVTTDGNISEESGTMMVYEHQLGGRLQLSMCWSDLSLIV